MTPLRLFALLAFVGFACWAIWPDDPSQTTPRGQSARSGMVAHASTKSPSTSTRSGDDEELGGVSVLGEDEATERVRVEGLVMDETKALIGGATVRLGALSVTTEADGSFAFDDAPSGDSVLRAELGDLYGETSAWISDSTDPIEITVRRGPTLVVHIKSATTNKPIADAKVHIASRDLVTNADGTVRARGLDVTGERFTITAEGFASWRGSAEFDGEHPTAQSEMTVKLESGASISGIVVDERGERVPEAWVALSGATGSWSDSVSADEHGAWTIPAIAAGNHTLRGSAKAHIATPDQIVVHDGIHPTTNVIVKVTLGAELVGRVVDDHGKPIEGASIRGAGGASSDADGRFTSVGLDPGELTISAYEGNRASPEQKVTVAIGKRVSVLLVIRDSSLAGRVVDRSGHPIPDASLYATSIDDSNTFFATSDEYGKFDFGGIPPGDYYVKAQREEEARRRLPEENKLAFRTGKRDITLVLHEVATVAGRVVLDGKPVGYYGVYVTLTPDKLWAEPSTIVNDPSGAFAQHDIAPGTWSIVIAGPGFAMKTITGVVVREGQTTDVGTITVDRGRVVAGQVTDATGRGVANATVVIGKSLTSFSKDRVEQRTQGDASATTDADGNYEIAGVPVEDLRIRAVSGTRTSLEEELGDRTTVNLVMLETGIIAGRIDNMKSEQIGVVATTGDALSASLSRFFGDIDAVGGFRITGVPPGSYELRVMGKNTLPHQSVTVVANQTTTAHFTMPVTPISIVISATDCNVLTLTGPADLHSLEVCSDGSATYEAVAPGAYIVCASYDECVPITVEAGPSTQRFVVRFPEASE